VIRRSRFPDGRYELTDIVHHRRGSQRSVYEISQGTRIDILVNNAGIFPRSTTATTDEATFDEVYAVNVKAPYFLTGAIAPAMAEVGQGAILNLGS
jgi:NAD(P)-dependent dehydrogenase (short-subunit alcohol dehydrogenase family)